MPGDKYLFISLPVTFHESNIAAAQKIRDAIMTGVIETAWGLIHAFKRSSGSISAIELFHASERLEKAAKNREADIDGLFKTFDKALQRILKSTSPFTSMKKEGDPVKSDS
jgi:HPt (histidine-containing phosphotransfer) domain-containing protein